MVGTPLRARTPKRGSSVASVFDVTPSRNVTPVPLPPPIPMRSSALSPPMIDSEGMKEVRLHEQITLSDPVRCAASNPSGRVIWTGHKSGTVTLRSAETASLEADVLFYNNGIIPNVMGYSPEAGGQVWIGFSDGMVRVFDYTSAQQLAELSSHTGAVLSLVVSGSHVFTGGQDWKIHQWCTQTLRLSTTLSGHKSAVRCLTTSILSQLISGSDDGLIQLWNSTRSSIKAHTSSVLCLTVSQNDIWSGGEDSTIAIWDISVSASPVLKRRLNNHKGPLTSLIQVPSSQAIWSTDKYGVVNIWHSVDCTLLQRISPDSTDWQRNIISVSTVVSKTVQWNVWTCSGDGNVRIWSSPCQTESNEMEILKAEILSLRLLLRHQSDSLVEPQLQPQPMIIDEDESYDKDILIRELESQLSLLSMEVETGKGFELELMKERKRRRDSDEAAAKNEARLVVLQQEVAARTRALGVAEEDRQKHRTALDEILKIERELELEKILRKEKEDLLIKSDFQYNTIQEELRLSKQQYDESFDHVKRESHILSNQINTAIQDCESITRSAIATLTYAESDTRSIICDLEHNSWLSIYKNLTATERIVSSAQQVLRAPSPAVVCITETAEMVSLRNKINFLEEALTKSTQQITQSAIDAENQIIKNELLQGQLLAHKHELAETASELATVKCELASVSAELSAKDSNIIKVTDSLIQKESEISSSTEHVARYKQNLEQNIACIAQLEIKLSESQATVLDFESSTRMLSQKISLSENRELELNEVMRQKDETLAAAEQREQTLVCNSESLLSSIDILQSELNSQRKHIADNEHLLTTTENEKTNLLIESSQRHQNSKTLEVLLDEKEREINEKDVIFESERSRYLADLAQQKEVITEMTGSFQEKEAKLEILDSQLATKTDQLNRQTAQLGDVVAECTDKRRQIAELSAKVEDYSLQLQSSDVVVAKSKETSINLEKELSSVLSTTKEQLRDSHEQHEGLRQELKSLKEPYEAIRIKLDTTMREMALLREDSQHEIRRLQSLLSAASAAASLVPRAPFPAGLEQRCSYSPLVSPRQYVLHDDDVPGMCLN